MSKTYDKPIVIQAIDETTETWENLYFPHASINKNKRDDKYLGSGAIQGKKNYVFEVRYFSQLGDIENNLSKYRILYKGLPFSIVDYDDYQLKHQTVKLLGVSY